MYLAYNENIEGFTYGNCWREDIGFIREVRAVRLDTAVALVDAMEDAFRKHGCDAVRILLKEDQLQLKERLIAHTYRMTTELLTFEKDDLTFPTEGNSNVDIKPFEEKYIDKVMEIEKTCFAPE